jgi:DNA (cytosine-5)-methyltransferase 1
VIFENVPNMLHLNRGETIRTIVDELEALGYNWAYRTIDSLAFVPQRRRRVYVVASLHCDPRNVILSGNSSKKYGEITSETFDDPCGFYWTEGKYALGLYKNAIPTLKCGSTIGISSPPAIAFPDGTVASPDIRDAERFQGFPADWTKPAEEVA